MDFGIAVTPSVDSWKVVRRAEELGFTHAWFYDSQLLYTDVFVAMALAAEHTTKIRLGTGVLVPSNRIAPVAANCLASLNRLAPGRIDFGVGTGFTARNTMGLPPMRLAEMASYVEVVRSMLRGEIAKVELGGRRRKVRFLHPDSGMIDVQHPVSWHLSAFAPRSRDLAAREADGWITMMGSMRGARAQAGAMDAACAAAGRAPGSLYRTIFSLGCVLRDEEECDSPRAMAQAGPWSAVDWHETIGRGEFDSLPESARPAAAKYQQIFENYEPADARYLSLHRGHLMFVRDDERPFVTAEMIRRQTLTATAPELRERVEALHAAGYHQLAIQLVAGHEEAIEDWARVFGLA